MDNKERWEFEQFFETEETRNNCEFEYCYSCDDLYKDLNRFKYKEVKYYLNEMHYEFHNSLEEIGMYWNDFRKDIPLAVALRAEKYLNKFWSHKNGGIY